MKIGIRIQERLKLLGMSQSELARRLNVPQSTINGLITRPRRSSLHLVRIARELLTTPAYLMGEVNDPGVDIPDTELLNAEEREWVDLLRAITPKDRSAALQLVKTIARSIESPSVENSRNILKNNNTRL